MLLCLKMYHSNTCLIMPRKNKYLTAEGKKQPQKIDISKNGVFNLDELKRRDNGKVLLRIDKNTVILVSPENKNEQYADAYRQRMERAKYNY